MNIDVNISIDDIVEAIESAGGVVKWEGEPPRRHRMIEFRAEVDDEEVADRFPADWFEPDEELTDDDPRDIRDFLAACLAGDRELAIALVPRLWGSPDAQATAEQVLRPVRRAA